jgi:hypothetical protein
MALFGLDIYNGNQQLVFTTTDTTWSLVGVINVAAGASETRAFPAAAGLTLITQQWRINVLPDVQEAYSHTVLVLGNTVEVQNNGTVSTTILVLAQ